MSKRIILLLLLSMTGSLMALAQTKLYFINRTKHKVIEVKEGHQLSIKYKGYLGQPEFVKQTVTEINDSMITLGVDPQVLGGFGKAMENNPKLVYRKIRIADILSFRRMTTARQLTKQGLMLVNVVASYFIFKRLFNNSGLSEAQVFFASLGIGVGTVVIIQMAFPENPKYKMEDGWEVTTGDVKPKL